LLAIFVLGIGSPTYQGLGPRSACRSTFPPLSALPISRLQQRSTLNKRRSQTS
jgi:hypothetical protein